MSIFIGYRIEIVRLNKRFLRDGELTLPVGAQTFIRTAGADAAFEYGVVRAGGLLQVR
jgi:hypothetical protein